MPTRKPSQKAAKKAGKRGRPVGEWAQHIPVIIDRVSQGETLTVVCEALGINPSTVRQAYATDTPPGFYDAYARAREAQAESWADAVIAEADRPGEYGERGVDSGEIALRKLRVDTRKWLMAKLHPRQYGEKLDVTSKGEQVSGVVVLPASDSKE